MNSVANVAEKCRKIRENRFKFSRGKSSKNHNNIFIKISKIAKPTYITVKNKIEKFF